MRPDRPVTRAIKPSTDRASTASWWLSPTLAPAIWWSGESGRSLLREASPHAAEGVAMMDAQRKCVDRQVGSQRVSSRSAKAQRCSRGSGVDLTWSKRGWAGTSEGACNSAPRIFPQNLDGQGKGTVPAASSIQHLCAVARLEGDGTASRRSVVHLITGYVMLDQPTAEAGLSWWNSSMGTDATRRRMP